MTKKNLRNETIISYIGLAILMLLLIIIRSKFLTMPFERDEGAYSYYGKLLLEGKIPYRDFYEQKFPGLFYFYAIFVALFGDTVKGMHAGFIVLNLATTGILFATAKKLFSPLSGLIAAISFGILSLTPYLSGFTVQSEHGVVFFASLAMLIFVYYLQNRKWYLQLLMGTAMGCAFMVKTPGLFFVAWGGIALIIQFLYLKERTVKLFIRETIFYATGVLLVVATLFFIIFIKGALSDMLFWTIYIPKHYVNKIPLADGINNFIGSGKAIFKEQLLFWIQGIIGIVICFFRIIKWREKLFILTLVLFSSLTIIPGLYFYGHYWIQLLPVISILSGLTFFGFTSLIKQKIDTKTLVPEYLYLLIFLLFTINHISQQRSYYFKPDFDKIQKYVYGENPFPESMEIANYINAHSKATDQIVVIGSEPEIYFYTQKKCPSRHAYFAALVDNIPEHRAWQREFVADVEKAAPRYFIYFNHSISLNVQYFTDKYIFEWIDKYINDNYKLIGLVDMIEEQKSIYVWNNDMNNYKAKSKNTILIYELKK